MRVATQNNRKSQVLVKMWKIGILAILECNGAAALENSMAFP